MRYHIELSKTAEKQLDKLPEKIAFLLIEAIELLADNPRPNGYRKLKGREGFRIRKGKYRVIYDIIDDILVVDVIAVGHRKKIYD